ncbi:hypothetical protein DAPPUDRAFT_262799 [Daphnia pulex]|uniref:Uncharacterized protein n=1 Tax=Daphnia pulex TaxID=6669 RepID=E9HNQ0_DAPPU|nr:hypothetical protein DAPPUDRAFT_262799 [Daphnia pulex]|eukprot:EFX66649.1 hypothetical protein DAPPUDRAFT_262799 [Daphnia pulex]
MFYSVGTGQLTNLKQKQIKQLTAQLSVEQQLYCKEITEACVCSDQARRAHSKVWLQILDCIKCYLACAPLSLKAFELTFTNEFLLSRLAWTANNFVFGKKWIIIGL